MTKKERLERLDKLTGELTGFRNFEEMLNAGGRYRPSMNVTDKEYGKNLKVLANAYDKAMEKANDDRRAFRF